MSTLNSDFIANRYKRGELIGHGQFADVYLAEDTSNGGEVAIKILDVRQLNLNPDLREQFEREVKATQTLASHNNVITILDSDFSTGSIPFIVMRYYPKTLHDVLNEEGPLDVETAIPLIEHIGNALTQAHDQGIIHLDVKPSNILLDTNHPSYWPVLTDFGLARMQSDRASSQTTSIKGTELYMAPEQWNRNSNFTPKPATDVYALAITFFEMLAGRCPFFDHNPLALAKLHEEEVFPCLSDMRPDVGDFFDQILIKGTAKKSENRPDNVKKFIQQIKKSYESFQQANWRIAEARTALSEDNYGNAQTDIERANNLHPNFVSTLSIKGDIAFKMNSFGDALQSYNSVESIYQKSHELTIEYRDFAKEQEDHKRRAFHVLHHSSKNYYNILLKVIQSLWLSQEYNEAVLKCKNLKELIDQCRNFDSLQEQDLVDSQQKWLDYLEDERGKIRDFIKNSTIGSENQTFSWKALEALGFVEEGQLLVIQEQSNIIKKLKSQPELPPEIFDSYDKIDRAYQEILKAQPYDNHIKSRCENLQEQAELRESFALEAENLFDYDAAVEHYNNALFNYQTISEECNSDKNKNMDYFYKKIADLEIKVKNYGEYAKIFNFIKNNDTDESWKQFKAYLTNQERLSDQQNVSRIVLKLLHPDKELDELDSWINGQIITPSTSESPSKDNFILIGMIVGVSVFVGYLLSLYL